MYKIIKIIDSKTRKTVYQVRTSCNYLVSEYDSLSEAQDVESALEQDAKTWTLAQLGIGQ